MELLGTIESILFVASKPLQIVKLAKVISTESSRVAEAIETLRMKYNRDDSGIHIFIDGDTVQMGTNPNNAESLKTFIKHEVSAELTKAQLETLTVIVYRGPMTRAELEQIRGVNCTIILRNLSLRGLIIEEESPHTVLPFYRVSIEALQGLGIHDVSELPNYEELNTHVFLQQEEDSNISL